MAYCARKDVFLANNVDKTDYMQRFRIDSEWPGAFTESKRDRERERERDRIPFC